MPIGSRIFKYWLEGIDNDFVNVSQPLNRIWILENTSREFLRVFSPDRKVAKDEPLENVVFQRVVPLYI